MSDFLQIAVPSRKRAHLMPKLLGLLPDAIIYIHKSEVPDYAGVVPDGQLRTHDVDRQMCAIRNAIFEDMERRGVKYVAQIDDDFTGIRSNIWRRPKKYKDAAVIRQVIANAAQIIDDLGKTVYAWNNAPASLFYDPTKCINLCHHFGTCWVARTDKRYDPEFRGFCGDVDFNLQVFFDDRIAIYDDRIAFEFLPMHGESGGLQDIRTEAIRAFDMERVKSKWKGHVVIRETNGKKFARPVVNRKSPLGFRG